MRYQIMDTLLDWTSVFVLGLLAMWMMQSVYAVLCAWWREGRQEVTVEVIENDDPQLNEWR